MTPLPVPPLEMRQLVGPTDVSAFDNPSGAPVFDFLPLATYRNVFDFGCGCGRLARQLIQQRPMPERYFGVDLHRGMIDWCRRNLTPVAPQFRFEHHDVYNWHFNPGADKPRMLPLPAEAGAFSLVEAWSVFTHLSESQAQFYLAQCQRLLSPDAILHTTWFLFDKREFPMLTPDQNALYASDLDPSAAVIFDRAWLRATTRALGLQIFDVRPTAPIRGFQWQVLLTPNRPDVVEV
ncbi:MAG: class I SAM-dependent methyltransferase, partial [Chloroflexi bacterium]|nr:class I SAM-dependent methyltransferase [Chloroflexota bacterium]